LRHPLQTVAKEYGRTTEIELNELLKGSSSGKRSGETVSGPRAQPARLQQPVMAARRKAGVEIGRNAGLPLFPL
jgi:hypothetical protein